MNLLVFAANWYNRGDESVIRILIKVDSIPNSWYW